MCSPKEQRLFQLAPRGLTTKELAERMGISQRSAQRDIAALESELEMPFVKQGSRYQVMPGFFLASINFSLQEAMALLLSARLMARFGPKNLAVAGMSILASGLLLLSQTDMHASYFPTLFIAYLLLGTGAGTSFLPLLTIGI